jgi:hypothetical protein
VQEKRESILEKRSMSASYLAEFNRGCAVREARSIATGREVRKILRPVTGKMTIAELRRLSKSTGRPMEEIAYGYSPKISQDRWLRMKMENYAAVIAKGNAELLKEKRKALLADTSPSGRIALREYLDVLAGVRPANPGARPYGFTDLRDARMESQGQEQDPQQSLRSYPSYDDGEDADEPEEHEKACRCHRSVVQLCSMRHGTEHLKAADAHDRAARTHNAENSQAARGASYRANHFKERGY